MAENNRNQLNQSCKTYEDDTMSEFDENDLLSLENMDTASPELSPDKTPGNTNVIANKKTNTQAPAPEWARGLTKEEYEETMKLAQMSRAGIIREVKSLYDEAYQLDLRSAQELMRGKCLGIFDSFKKK